MYSHVDTHVRINNMMRHTSGSISCVWGEGHVFAFSRPSSSGDETVAKSNKSACLKRRTPNLRSTRHDSIWIFTYIHVYMYTGVPSILPNCVIASP